jgi:Prokaryotic E2 family E/Multiubiquitin
MSAQEHVSALEIEIIDLEEWSKTGKRAPQDRRYRIRIDRKFYVVQQTQITGRQLLALAEKTPPERFSIFQKLHGGEAKKISLDENVDLTTPGIERFYTLPLGETEGFSDRKDFQLPSEDVLFLEASGFAWETITEQGVQRVVINDFPLPSGYNQTSAQIFITISTGYPDTALDMMNFCPALTRLDGKGIRALTNVSFDGKLWQQWSRHRTTENPWRPGEDCLETHLALVKYSLEHELTK